MITKTRDLRTGTPVWKEYRTPRIAYARLNRGIKTDILVVGAGISGAMMAEALQAQGFEVVVVDKRPPLSGATAASTALVQFGIDVPLSRMIPMIGLDKSVAAWRRSKLAVESLAVKIRNLDVDCDYKRVSSLYLPGNVLSAKQLEKEGDLRNLIGLQGEMIDGRALRNDYGLKAKCALQSLDDMAVNPVQLSAGFLKGIKIFSPVEVKDMSHHKNHVEVVTDQGFLIKAKAVIFATGYEIPKYIKTKKHSIESTWAISTKPVKGLPKDFPHIWEAANPYGYARATQDGRIMFGGEDEKFSDEQARDALIPEKAEKLLKKLQSLLPDYDFELEHAWTGSFGASKTGLPSIGQIPHRPDCYVVMAYGGNGITFSRIAADIIAAKIAGKNDPDEKLFAFR